MPNRRLTLTLLAIATVIAGSAAWSTADARLAHKPATTISARN
ncbi:hypothetical protein [Sphingomonas sp. R-74633]|nr:hypothetical protein [Sphingomonas sp. R-74633]